MHLCNKLRSLNRIGRMRIQKARELTAEVCFTNNFIEKKKSFFFSIEIVLMIKHLNNKIFFMNFLILIKKLHVVKNLSKRFF
jgi:hypothetical protein